MPHLLDLFCGTKSISKVFERNGWRCSTLDINPKMKPTICVDILDVTAETIIVYGWPDVIWASPLCTHYSRARTTAKTPRDLEGSDALIRKVLDLAEFFECPLFLENPYSGLLKTRDVISHIYYRVVDYCQYSPSDWARYRKRTAIWSNTGWIPERKLCNPKTCRFCSDGRKHDEQAQRGFGKQSSKQSLNQLYSIPPALAEEICSYCLLTI